MSPLTHLRSPLFDAAAGLRTLAVTLVLGMLVWGCVGPDMTSHRRARGPLFTPFFLQPVPISLDARSLKAVAPTFDILGVTGSLPTTTIQDVLILPGRYTLRAPAGGGAGSVSFDFLVKGPCDLMVP